MRKILCVMLGAVVMLLFCACKRGQTVETESSLASEEGNLGEDYCAITESELPSVKYEKENLDAFFEDLVTINFGEVNTGNENLYEEMSFLRMEDEKSFPVPTVLSENYTFVSVTVNKDGGMTYCFKLKNSEDTLSNIIMRVYNEEGFWETKIAKCSLIKDGMAYREQSNWWIVDYGQGKSVYIRFYNCKCPANVSQFKRLIRLDLYEITPDGVVKVDDITHKPTA